MQKPPPQGAVFAFLYIMEGMDWAMRRQRIVWSVFGAVALAFLIVVGIAVFYKTPACTDCGALAQNIHPAQVRFARAVVSSVNRTDVIAYVDNPNPDEAAQGVLAKVEVYDVNHALLASRDVTFDLTPGGSTAVFVDGILPSATPVSQTFFTIDAATVPWVRTTAKAVVPTIQNGCNAANERHCGCYGIRYKWSGNCSKPYRGWPASFAGNGARNLHLGDSVYQHTCARRSGAGTFRAGLMSELVRLNPLRAVLATWPMLVIAVTIALLGILTMHPFDGASSLAPRQLIWITLGVIVYLVCAVTDMRFIRRTPVIITGYVLVLGLLSLLLVVGHATMGAKSWFTLGTVAFQPSDLAKLVVIGLLAKYFPSCSWCWYSQTWAPP